MKKSLLAVVLAIAIIATQFCMILPVSAETTDTALTGRDDFVFGVNVRASNSWKIYQEAYSSIIDAKSLGSTIIRIEDREKTGDAVSALNPKYVSGLAEIAKQNGMEIMLTDPDFISYVKDVEVANVNIEAINQYYTELATTLKGQVAYYQLGNEMDSVAKKADKSGLDATHYNNLEAYAVAIYTAVNAIKAADSDAKVVVNTSWLDVGFIEGIKAVKIDTMTGTVAESGTTNVTTYASWDLIGLDWYSNGRNEDFKDANGKVMDYDYAIERLSVWDEDVIICEANLWPQGIDGEGNVTYMEDAEWLADFVKYAYSQPKVKGFLAYELYDVAGLENDEFNKEAHYGLIDKNGQRKETFNVLQALYGGTDVERVENIPAVTSDNEMAGEILSKVYSDVKPVKLDNLFNGFGEDNNSNEFFTTSFKTTNIASVQSELTLELDVYVEDASAFKAAAQEAGLKLYVALFGGERVRGAYAQNIELSNISNDGWNHIVLSGYHFDTSNGLESIWNSTVDEIVVGYLTSKANYNPASGMTVAVSNVCFTKIAETKSTVGSQPAKSSTGYSKQFDKKIYQHRLNSSGNYSSLTTDSTHVDSQRVHLWCSSSDDIDYIEFDIYIDNYENFQNSLKFDADGNAVNYGIGFNVSSSGNKADTAWTRFVTYDITKYISHSGWNHIVLKVIDQQATTKKAISPLVNNSLSSTDVHSYSLNYINYNDRKSVGNFYYYNKVTDTTVKNAAARDYIAMTNVILSQRVAPDFESKDTVEVTRSTEASKTFKIGDYYVYVNSNSKIQLNSAFDASAAEFIEFDLFVENDEIVRELSETCYEGKILYRLYNSKDMDGEQGYASVDIADQIKVAGWNHIIIPKSSFSLYKGFSFENINAMNIRVDADSDKVSSGTNNSKFTFAFDNLIGTISLNTPDKLMSDYTLIGEDKTIEFETTDAEGSFVFTYELAENVDISADKMIELDIYVESVSSVSGNTLFMLMDSSDNVATFDITSQIIADGWNHIQIDIADFEIEEFSYDAIKVWSIINDGNGLNGYIANVYAADYVEFDINRDGEMNILDLVRAKKHSVGNINAQNNICAADYDGDYEIDAIDLTKMRIALLTGF